MRNRLKQRVRRLVTVHSRLHGRAVHPQVRIFERVQRQFAIAEHQQQVNIASEDFDWGQLHDRVSAVVVSDNLKKKRKKKHFIRVSSHIKPK